jgi:predicted nucleotidyltransferase
MDNDVKVEYHKTLNPKLWDGYNLKPEVRKQLLAITNSFLTFCNLPIKVDDILLVGSSANFNWTGASDIDLMIKTDFADSSDPSLVKEFFATKKQVFKRDHDIKIYGMPVEITVSDINGSDGEFSVANNLWLTVPQYHEPEFDRDKVKTLADKWKNRIISVVRDNDASVKDMVKVKKSIKKARAKAVETEDPADKDEFHPMNLAYKHLRKKGYLDMLKKAIKRRTVDDLSLKRQYNHH